jgi:hypothetical protein
MRDLMTCSVCGAMVFTHESGMCLLCKTTADMKAKDAEIARLRGLMFGAAPCEGEREGLKGIICHDCELWAGYCRVDNWEPPGGEG